MQRNNNMKTNRRQRSSTSVTTTQSSRKGSIIVLAILSLVIVFVFAAFTVDFGMIAVTKGQMQNATDSASHAAMLELMPALGVGATYAQYQAEADARQRAVEMIGRFRTGDLATTQADAIRDVRLGRRSWDSGSQSWTEEWGVTPYNMVEVTARRTDAVGAALPMNFARVLGMDHHDLEVSSVASVSPVVGFRIPTGTGGSGGGGCGGACRLDILPIALDLGTWNALVDQIHHGIDNGFEDEYSWHETLQTVNSYGDTVPEVNIYPDQNTNMPPGNRGTVDFGSPNNSTNDLKRQIVDGLNSYDLSFFPNDEIRFNSQGVLYLNGDTGISAGIEASLKSIIGQVRAMPIFISVSGPGNNANYTIVKFVGVRIMAVKLRGGPTRRYLSVQPARFMTPCGIRGNASINVDSILSMPHIIH
jgi:hypothetical protein